MKKILLLFTFILSYVGFSQDITDIKIGESFEEVMGRHPNLPVLTYKKNNYGPTKYYLDGKYIGSWKDVHKKMSFVFKGENTNQIQITRTFGSTGQVKLTKLYFFSEKHTCDQVDFWWSPARYFTDSKISDFLEDGYELVEKTDTEKYTYYELKSYISGKGIYVFSVYYYKDRSLFWGTLSKV